MAANKFATMLHRNTNKITLILIYAVLEWTLIVLLLLNSLFSYLIIKFANYFGLKSPCLWCSRIDDILEPRKNKNMYRDLLCEVHATEISRIGYCSNHQKLAESQDMCEDCLSSRPDFHGASDNFTFFPWMKQIGMIQNSGDKVVENGDLDLNCSCCGVSLNNKIYSPCIVIKPSWGVLDYAQERNLITEAAGDDHHIEECNSWDQIRSDFATDHRCVDEHRTEIQMLSDVNGGFGEAEEETVESSVSASKFGLKHEKVGMDFESEKDIIIKEENSVEDPSSDETMVQVCSREGTYLEIVPQHLEFFLDCSGHQLIPVELIDSTTDEYQRKYRVKDDQESTDPEEANLGSELCAEVKIESIVDNICSAGRTETLISVHEEPKFAVLESMETEETENSLVFGAEVCESVKEVYEQVGIPQVSQSSSDGVDYCQAMTAGGEEKVSDVPSVVSEDTQMPINETEAEVSIGTEIPDLDITDEIQTQETPSLYAGMYEDPSSRCLNFHANDDHGSKNVQEETVELKTLSVELSSVLNEIEGQKVPDTPTSIESLHHLHKKLLLLERRDSGTEESLDGSFISELEGGEGVLTTEHLKSALRAERKALHALYAELEEERSASAVAANQTMAMINRLQEEKAAMQMEALQYQRMMEEQSEYDQEALQLLNDLMVKREKEKQEIEKELDIYRKKVLDYEAKEKMRMLRSSKDGSVRSGFSSASCSNAEDSDGLSIDLNQEAKEEDRFYGHQESGNHNTPVDAVVNLEESLDDFEDERLSILEQLKVLEENLFTLGDEEGKYFVDVKPIEHSHEQNGKHFDENSDSEVNGIPNGFSKEVNGKHYQERRIMGSKAKRLLPLFDAISTENEDGILNGYENGFDSNGAHNSIETEFESESKKLAVEEEVDHLYGRLQALEADREFLKHCISSLKKGDKGMDLLQEILQHLRDLRNVDLRVKNLSDGASLI